METRLATEADLPALAALHAESFGAAAWSLVQIAESLRLPTSECWIVSINNVAQGFILIQVTGDEVEILTFCVTPPARHKGVGLDLLQKALENARQRNATRVFLEVAADNMTALSLYEKQGFQVLSRRMNYYTRGDRKVDAITYGIELLYGTPA
jgi:ribosomal-protein-alanine N-acetyltransferase